MGAAAPAIAGAVVGHVGLTVGGAALMSGIIAGVFKVSMDLSRSIVAWTLKQPWMVQALRGAWESITKATRSVGDAIGGAFKATGDAIGKLIPKPKLKRQGSWNPALAWPDL